MRDRLLVAAIVAYAVSRGVILFWLEPDSWDTSVYYSYATAVAHGATPYSAALPIEYPPVAMWTMRVPFAVARGVPSLTQYRHSFRLEMALCDVAAFALFVAIVRRRRPELAGTAAATYTVVTAILANVLYDRLDVALAALILAWAYAYLRSAGSRVWTAIAYGALGLGISFKLVPIVIAPVLAVCELRSRDRTRLAIAGGAAAITALLPFALYLPGVLGVLRVHSIRGIQVESLYASVAALAAQLGAHVAIAPSYGSFNLVGGIADVLKPVSAVALVGLVAGVAIASWRRRAATIDGRDVGPAGSGAEVRRGSIDGRDVGPAGSGAEVRRGSIDGRDVGPAGSGAEGRPGSIDGAYRYGLATLAGAVIASNVLSPQYFIWALPVALLLAAEIAPDHFASASACAVAVAGLTTWVFPYHYIPDVVPASMTGPMPATFAYVVIAARNLLYLGLVVWLYRRLPRPASPMPSASLRQA